MDLKEEVRRRIADLTRLAYERGYRDGAQSALAEIEKVSAEDLADQLKELPAALRVLRKTGAPGRRRSAATRKPEKPKKRQGKAKVNVGVPKAVTVQRCIQGLIASKGEARRGEILPAARAEDPKITSKDVHNGIRTLNRRGQIRVDPRENSRLLPSEAQPVQTSAS